MILYRNDLKCETQRIRSFGRFLLASSVVVSATSSSKRKESLCKLQSSRLRGGHGQDTFLVPFMSDRKHGRRMSHEKIKGKENDVGWRRVERTEKRKLRVELLLLLCAKCHFLFVIHLLFLSLSRVFGSVVSIAYVTIYYEVVNILIAWNVISSIWKTQDYIYYLFSLIICSFTYSPFYIVFTEFLFRFAYLIKLYFIFRNSRAKF